MYELSVHLRADHIARCIKLNSDDGNEVRVCTVYTATKRKKIAINIHAVEQMTSNKQMKVKVNIKPLMKTDTGTGSQNTLTVLPLGYAFCFHMLFIVCLCFFQRKRNPIYNLSSKQYHLIFFVTMCLSLCICAKQ